MLKKIMLLSLVITFSVLAAEYEIVGLDKLQQIADRNAEFIWGNVSPAEAIPYYSTDEEIVAYRFNYALGKNFPGKQNLIEECKQMKIEGKRDSQWGVDEYGQLLISARTNMPVILEHSKCLSPEYALGFRMQELAKKDLGNNYHFNKAYYLDYENIWYSMSNGYSEIYICLNPVEKVISVSEFTELKSSSEFFCETKDYSNEWNDFINGRMITSRSDTFISNYELCPFYDWSYGCGPTAASMVLAWWDYNSINTTNNYAKLVDYHFTRYDDIQNEWDYQVPNLLEELADAMGTDSSGSTQISDLSPGIEEVANTINGYNFSASHITASDTDALFSLIEAEIDSDRPVLTIRPNHGMCCIGYNSSNGEVILHNTLNSSLVYRDKSVLTGFIEVIPGGSSGLAINLTSPLGDTGYNHDGDGEEYIAGCSYDITWDSDSSPGSYVNIFVSTDEGVDGTWTAVATGTDNDGSHPWTIPSTMDSEGCRIMTRIYDSGTLAGCDASFGNFIVRPSSIIGTEVVYDAEDEGFYKFWHTFSSWCAVGIRANPDYQDWDIKMYSDECFSTELESSETSYNVDFIVMDGNHSPSQWRGIKTWISTENYYTSDKDLEFEGFGETLSMGSNSLSWPAEDVVEMRDIQLDAGDYEFILEYDAGTADLDFALFGSSGSAYYGNRNDYLARSINSGSGVDESFTYTATSNDLYGLCIWANDNNTADFFIKIIPTNTWEGDVSVNWHNPNNWSNAAVPTEYTNAYIPSGTPYSPKIYTNDAECNDLELESGADLLIAAKTLDVMRDMDIDGALRMNNTSGVLNVYEDLDWGYSSTANISADANINIEGDWRFGTGSDALLENGTVTFTGSEDTKILCFMGDCGFNNVTIEKSSAEVNFYHTSLDSLLIEGDLQINSTASFNSDSDYPIVLTGDFTNNGHYYFDEGTFVLTGTSKTIDSDSWDYFHDLTINTTDLCVLSYNITIEGDLLLESGGLDTGSYDIDIGGDWTNNIGDTGFDERYSDVNFIGEEEADINTDETFYHLNLEKTFTGYEALELDSGITVNIENDLNILDGTLEMNSNSTLNIGDDLTISLDAGLNANSDTNLNIIIEGDWNNENTTYDTEIGFHPGTSSTVTFEGAEDQYIYSDCSAENFFNLTIDKDLASTRSNQGTAFSNQEEKENDRDVTRSNNVISDCDLNIDGDFSIDNGIFFAPNEMYVTGDWYNYYNDLTFVEGTGTVVFDGSSTSYFYSDETFKHLEIDKSTTVSHGVVISDSLTVRTTSDLDISNGSLEMNDYSTLFIGNCLTIAGGAGLNACDDTGLNISVKDDWTNDNTGYDEFYGFNPGTSTVTFDGGAYQVVTTNCPQEEFYDLNIEKSSGDFRPGSSIGVLNDLVIDGNWHYDVSGLTHYFQGDVLIDTNAVWTDNVGSISFSGTSDQTVEVIPTANIFNNVWIDVTAGSTVSLLSDMNPHSGGYLRVNSGTLDLNGNSYYCDACVDVLGGTLSIEDNECLYIGGGYDLTVDSGGTLETKGTSGNEATITCITTPSYYNFYVEDGGILDAEHTIFEYMSTSGVWIETDGVVGGSNPFYHCTFQNGETGGTLLQIDNAETFTADGVCFPTTGGTFNVGKSYDTGDVTFTGYSGSFAGDPFENDPYARIHWGTSTPRCNLVIAAIIFPGVRHSYYACDVIDIELKIKNIGNEDVWDTFFVDMYFNLDDPPEQQQQGDRTIQIDSLAAGDSLFIVFDNIWSEIPIEWHTYFQIDRGDQIPESDENNIPPPEIINWQPLPVISDLEISIIPGERDEDSIELHWSYPIGINRFKVYRGLNPEFPLDELHFVGTTMEPMFIDQIQGDNRFYRVTAERDAPRTER